MSSAPTIPPLTGTITVDAPLERAFLTFTDAFGSWWPAEYHIGQADMATAILEPRAGGRWYEQGSDGSECDWGRVRPPSTSNTGIWSGWSTARRSATGSPVGGLDQPPGAVRQGGHQPSLNHHPPASTTRGGSCGHGCAVHPAALYRGAVVLRRPGRNEQGRGSGCHDAGLIRPGGIRYAAYAALTSRGLLDSDLIPETTGWATLLHRPRMQCSPRQVGQLLFSLVSVGHPRRSWSSSSVTQDPYCRVVHRRSAVSRWYSSGLSRAL
jgi:hypothetical protein